MKSLRAIVTSVAAASAAVLCLGLASVPAAQAAPAAKATPNPCHTFTTKAADALLGAAKRAHLQVTLVPKTQGFRQCKVTYRKLKLTISDSTTGGGFGGPFKCYKRPKLGPAGTVCVSDVKSLQETFAVFSKDSIFFADDFNKTLAHKGAALYTFALAQYKAYKG
jgi:hypothetical protein